MARDGSRTHIGDYHKIQSAIFSGACLTTPSRFEHRPECALPHAADSYANGARRVTLHALVRHAAPDMEQRCNGRTLRSFAVTLSEHLGLHFHDLTSLVSFEARFLKFNWSIIESNSNGCDLIYLPPELFRHEMTLLNRAAIIGVFPSLTHALCFGVSRRYLQTCIVASPNSFVDVGLVAPLPHLFKVVHS
jgi:hypothetical protein